MLMNFDLQSYLYLDKTKKHKNKHGQIICQHYELFSLQHMQALVQLRLFFLHEQLEETHKVLHPQLISAMHVAGIGSLVIRTGTRFPVSSSFQPYSLGVGNEGLASNA